MNKTQIKTAPRETDAVNVVWRSHAADIMRRACPKLTDDEVCLGRLKLKDFGYKRLNGYVVFYKTDVCRKELSLWQRVKLWWRELYTGEKLGNRFVVMVKAFKNDKNKPRKVVVLPLQVLESESVYRPNNTFRAVMNTEWRYAVRGSDCEIITETFYRREKG